MWLETGSTFSEAQPKVAQKPAERKPMTLYQRIANGTSDTIQKAQDFLVKHGQLKATTTQELAYKLATVVSEKGEIVLSELAKLHPDHEFIIANTATSFHHNDTGNYNALFDTYSKRCDCGCNKYHSDSGLMSNIIPAITPGQNLETKNKLDITELAALTIIGLSVVTVLSLILNKSFSNGK